MQIVIKTIKHEKHRYPTVGDWWWDEKNTLQIRVSEMSDPRFEQLVALHEVVEALLCDQDNVDEADVTAFDVAFERNRAPGNTTEPGDSPQAPYYKQHRFATGVEHVLAAALGVDWTAYEKEVASLC